MSADEAKLRVSPESTVFDAVRAAQAKRLPADEASKIPKCVTVPHAAEAAAKDTVALIAFEVPEAAAHFEARATRAYEPPETSVPPPASVGAAVNRPT